MKVLRIVVKWIFIICLPFLFFSASIALVFNSEWIFHYGFQKYNVAQTTGLSDAELSRIPSSWTRYINSGEEYWQIIITRDGSSFDLFTQEEQYHFKDVKQLIWLDYRVLAGVLVFALGYSLTSLFWRRPRYWRQLAVNVVWGSGISIGLIIVLGVASLLAFDRLFLQLHYLIFTNPFWSAQGYMLLLFPEGFWFDGALIWVGMMAGMAIIPGVVATVLLKMNQRKSLSLL